MVLISEAGRVALVIVLLAVTSFGAAWAYTAYTGPLTDAPPPYVEEDGIFLVTYRTEVWELATPAQDFPQDGELTFEMVEVPIQNVSSVQVILQVSMRGPSANDQYEVTVTDPVSDSRTGSHEVPLPTTEGYIRSDQVIDWSRTVQPTAQSYHVDDRETALQRSAENHTDTSAKGEWSAHVKLNPPLIGRSGNASLLLRMTHYEAIVLPQTRPTETAPQPGNATEPNNTTTADDVSPSPTPLAMPGPTERPEAKAAAPAPVPSVPNPGSRPYPERSL